MLTNSLTLSISFICLVTSVQRTDPEYPRSLKQIYFSVLSWGTSNISKTGFF